MKGKRKMRTTAALLGIVLALAGCGERIPPEVSEESVAARVGEAATLPEEAPSESTGEQEKRPTSPGPETVKSEALPVKTGDTFRATGTLRQAEYYREDEHQGTAWILELEEPVLCALTDEWMGYDGNEFLVDSVQLAGMPEEPEGRRITVEGSVVIGSTSHHFREIVLYDWAALEYH